MKCRKIFGMVALILGVAFFTGCDSDGGSGGGSGEVGNYAGTWTGNVCGRGLTLVVNQDGTSLSGTYTLTDPAFSEAYSGTVAAGGPPASADLMAGADRMFAITFNSESSLSGGFFKGGEKVCDVNATK